MSEERIGDLTGRVTRVEADVSDLKASSAAIAVSLRALADSSEERFDTLKASLESLHKAVGCVDTSHDNKLRAWLREILTPQTVAIILAILAAAVGAPMLSQNIIETSLQPEVAVQDAADTPTPDASPGTIDPEEPAEEAEPTPE